MMLWVSVSGSWLLNKSTKQKTQTQPKQNSTPHVSQASEVNKKHSMDEAAPTSGAERAWTKNIQF
jgi:hypothetical protein